MTALEHDITSLYSNDPATSATVDDAVRILRETGAVLALGGDVFHSELSAACVSLVRDHIQALRPDALDNVAERVRVWGSLPVPHLPKAPAGYVDETNEPELFMWVDPRRIVPNRAVDERFIAQAEWYAAKILREQASPDSLAGLFGTMDLTERSHIHGVGWRTPAGPIVRIGWNGNHRLAALAALGVPCVLVRLRQHAGPYRCSGAPWDDDVERYRRLLQAYDVASFADGTAYPSAAFTEWPILLTSPDAAVDSLRAFEARAGAPVTGSLGHLPAEVFGDAATLRAAGKALDAALATALGRTTGPRALAHRLGDWLQRL